MASPNVLKFIHSKDDDRSIQNFNISVAVTDVFMKAVEAGGEYELVNPRTRQPAGRLDARRVFGELVQSAWKTGDPVPELGPIEATNPCGEQPLYSYDSCNLGSINLARMVTDELCPAIDWERLERIVYTAVRFLDNVVTMNRYPVEQIQRVSLNIRRIGLGVMGWADLLLVLGVPYDSEEALALGERVMAFIQDAADEASGALAEERGVFPLWDRSVYGPGGPLGPKRLRNSTRTTIAPTGTISIIANCSSGVEPLFALSYVRNVMDNTRLVEVNPYFEAVARREGFYSEGLMRELAERGGVRGMLGIPEWVQRLFVTAHDITPEWHVRMQAAFQTHTDNAVSKTANFPHEATVDDVRTVYLQAYQTGCKGVTIYRDGSKSVQVLSTGQTERARQGVQQEQTPHAAEGSEPASVEAASSAPQPPGVLAEAEEIAAGPVPRRPRERPTVLAGVTHRVRSGHGNVYVTVNVDGERRPFEIFTTVGKVGGCDAAQLDALSRLISLALRSGVDINAVVEQLRGITCCPAWDDGVMVRSVPDALALALSRHSRESGGPGAVAFDERTMHGAQLGLFNPASQTGSPQADAALREAHGAAATQSMRCPDCSGKLSYQEGCLMCHACGFNKCG